METSVHKWQDVAAGIWMDLAEKFEKNVKGITRDIHRSDGVINTEFGWVEKFGPHNDIKNYYIASQLAYTTESEEPLVIYCIRCNGELLKTDEQYWDAAATAKYFGTNDELLKEKEREKIKAWAEAATQAITNVTNRTPEDYLKVWADQIEEEHMFTSSPTAVAGHSLYKKILDLGKKNKEVVIKFLLGRIENFPFWYYALVQTAGVNPLDSIPKADIGNIKKMNNAWWKWGYEQGYIPSLKQEILEEDKKQENVHDFLMHYRIGIVDIHHNKKFGTMTLFLGTGNKFLMGNKAFKTVISVNLEESKYSLFSTSDHFEIGDDISHGPNSVVQGFDKHNSTTDDFLLVDFLKDAMEEDPTIVNRLEEELKYEEISAHICISKDGKMTIRNWSSGLCSNCRPDLIGGGFNITSCRIELDRLKKFVEQFPPVEFGSAKA
jgi:hypothetical protein